MIEVVWCLDWVGKAVDAWMGLKLHPAVEPGNKVELSRGAPCRSLE